MPTSTRSSTKMSTSPVRFQVGVLAFNTVGSGIKSKMKLVKIFPDSRAVKIVSEIFPHERGEGGKGRKKAHRIQ